MIIVEPMKKIANKKLNSLPRWAEVHRKPIDRSSVAEDIVDVNQASPEMVASRFHLSGRDKYLSTMAHSG